MNGAPRGHHRLGLWGPVSAGKTALLAQLLQATPPGNSGWEVLPGAAARDFVESTRRRLRQENRFPAATTLGATQALELHFRHRTSRATATLHMHDQPGGYSQEFEPIREQLAAADGLVLLLDPTYEPALLEGYLRRTLEGLSFSRQQPTELDPRPIAVCLSKADLRIHTAEDLASATADPEDFARRGLEARWLAPLATYCERFRLFPVSAVGLRLSWGVAEPLVFLDETGSPRLCPHGQPVNHLAPFTWVLDQLEKV